MKTVRTFLGIAAAVAGVAVLASCASAPKLKGTEKIAIVSYSIEKSIVKEGDSPDRGPGLLNDKTTYYQHHQEALDQAWTAFKAKAPEVFGPDRLVDIGTIEGNADVAASAASTNSMLADMCVHPADLGYVSLLDEKQNAKLAAATKADLVMGISIKAGYAMYNGLSIGGIGGGQANMRLTATVCLADANGKLVRRSVVYGQGTETALIGSIGAIGMGMDPAQFPRLIVSAQEDLLKNLAKEFASW